MFFRVKGFFCDNKEAWKVNYRSIKMPNIDALIEGLISKFAYSRNCVGFLIYTEDSPTPIAGLRKTAYGWSK